MKKKTSVTSIFKGTLAAAGALFIYAIPLGCFIALMLLVVSMEDGSDGLTALTVSLTEGMVLLSQGVPFTFGTITMAIMPLTLSVLLIALIAQCLKKAGPKADVWLSGLLAWVLLNQFCIRFTHMPIHDDNLSIAGKSAVIWLLGTALAIISSTAQTRKLRDIWRKQIPQGVRSVFVVSVKVSLAVVTLMLLIGLIAVIAWVVNGNASVNKLFELTNMHTGSRIMTSISYLAWLSNMVIWAISWITGAGFAIGDLGTFTLWVGQSTNLPPLPLFGIFPSPVSDSGTRLALQMCIPMACALSAITAMLFGPLKIRLPQQTERHETRHLVSLMIRHALMLCGAAIIILLLSWGMFAVSNGALGEKHLATVGVDVVASMRMVGWAIRQGFIAAWLVAVIAVALLYGIRWLLASRRNASDDSMPTQISLQTTAREENDDSKSSD